MPRDNEKCRKWEQERRLRLKEKFSELAKVLPSYDPSKQLCHVTILDEARKAIQELQEDLKGFLNEDKVKTIKDEIIKKLQKRIKKLLTRNEELNNLLKNGSKPVNKVKRFKISPELEKKLQQQEMEKENSFKWLQTKKKKKTITNNTSIAPKHQRTKKNSKSKNICQNTNASSNCLLFIPPNNSVSPNITPALNQPFYLIANSPPTTNIQQPNNDIGLQQTRLITRSIPCINPPAPTLGPGTIVFSNGSILPVLPQSSVIIQPPRAIISVQKNTFGITLPTVTTPKIIANTKKANNKITSTKKLNKITNSENDQNKLQLISPLKKCVTNTTQINKVPIPAITTNYTPILNNAPVINSVPEKIKKSGKVQKLSRNALIRIHKRNATSKRKVNHAEPEIISKKCKMNTSKESSKVNGENSGIDVATTSTDARDTGIGSEVKETEQAFSKMLNALHTIATDKLNVDKEEKALESTIPKENASNDDGNAKNQEITNPQLNENLLSSQNSTTKTNILTTTTNKTIVQDNLKSIELNLSHSELSNEIFATLQVPSGCQNPDSTSPTAAFLLSFPLVSSFKGNDVTDEPNCENQNDAEGLNIQKIDESKTTNNISDFNTDLPVLSSNKIAEEHSLSSQLIVKTCTDKANNSNVIIKNEGLKNSITQNINISQRKTYTEDKLFVTTHSFTKKICKSENNQEQGNTQETTYINTSQEKKKNIVVSSEDIELGEISKGKTILILDHVIVSKETNRDNSKDEISTSAELRNTSKENDSINQSVFKITELDSDIPNKIKVINENVSSNVNEDKNDSDDLQKHNDNKQQSILWKLNSLTGISQELSQFENDKFKSTEELLRNAKKYNTTNTSTENESGSKPIINQEVHILKQQNMNILPCETDNRTGELISVVNQYDTLNNSNEKESSSKPSISQEVHTTKQQKIDILSCNTDSLANSRRGELVNMVNQYDTPSNGIEKESGSNPSICQEGDILKLQKIDILSCKTDSLAGKGQQNYVKYDVKQDAISSHNDKKPDISGNPKLKMHKNVEKNPEHTSETSDHNWNSKLDMSNNSPNKNQLPHKSHIKQSDFSRNENTLSKTTTSNYQKLNHCVKRQSYSVENVINNQIDPSAQSENQHNIISWNSNLIQNSDTQKFSENTFDNNLHTSNLSGIRANSKHPILHEVLKKQMYHFVESLSNFESLKENQDGRKQKKTLENTIIPCNQTGISSVPNKEENTLLWNPEIFHNQNNIHLPKQDKHLQISSLIETKGDNKNQAASQLQQKQDILFLEQNSVSENVYEANQNKTVLNKTIHSSSQIDKEQNSLLWNPEFNLQTSGKLPSPIKQDQIRWSSKSAVNNNSNKNQILSQSQKKGIPKSAETSNDQNNIQYGQHISTENEVNHQANIYSKLDKGQNMVLWNSELNLNPCNKQLPALTSDLKHDHSLWNLKSVTSSEPDKNQTLPQNTRPQNTFCNLDIVPEIKFQSVPGVFKQQNILATSKSDPEININEKDKLLQSSMNRDAMLWNLDLNTGMDTCEIQGIHDHNKGHNCNVANIKPSGNLETNFKCNEKDTCLLYSQPSTENVGLLVQEKAKNQELPNSYIWNPESIITHVVNKKQINQTKTDTLWSKHSVEAADLEKNGNITKKDDSTFWNTEVHKNMGNVPEDNSHNQINHKQEIYLWNSKAIVPPVSTNHMSNFVVQNIDNNLWKSESRLPATSTGQGLIHPDKTQNTNLWQLEAVTATDINKTTMVIPNEENQVTKSHKNQNTPYCKPQNTVSWKSESSANFETYKSQNKKHMSLINPQSIVAPDSVQSKLPLQSCAKDTQVSWNPESLLGFDFHNKQSSASWNPQLRDSKNDHVAGQSTKKTGNALWNPESVVVAEPNKNHPLQLDKKQGSHLWNPESIVAVDVFKSQISISIGNSEKQCKNFWYPDSSIAPDHYKAQNIHTCSRYSSQPVSQPPTQSVSNTHYTSVCPKHNDPSNAGNLVFQNSGLSNGNLWPTSHYSSSNQNQVSDTSKINEYNVGNTWAPDLNKTNSHRKTNENAIDNVLNSGNVKLDIERNLHYNTSNCVQNSSLWPINQFEKTSTVVPDQFKKPKELTGNNNKFSGNDGNSQNDFSLHYNLVSGFNNANNPIFSAIDVKKNIWNMHQPQEVNNCEYSIPENSKSAKHTVLQNVENNEKQSSLQGSVNINHYNQSNIPNQNMWSVKNVHSAGHDQLYHQLGKISQSKDKLPNSMEKPGIRMEFPLKETLHEKRDIAYNICKDKSTSSNTNPTESKSLIFDQNAQTQNKNSFNSPKTQNTIPCNNLKEQGINVSKTVFGFDKTHVSNSNNFGLYLEPTISSKTVQSNTTNYNTHIEKNKSSSTNQNKITHISTSMNSLQNQVNSNNNIKESDQKSQYYLSNIYPTVSTNIGFQNETQKDYHTSTYTNFNKDYSTPLYTTPVNINHNVTATTFNENYYKNKPEIKYGPANYNSIQDPSSSSTKYYSTASNSSRKHNTSKGKHLSSTKPVNWMTTPENKMQTADCFLQTCSAQSYSLSTCIITTSNTISTVQRDDKKHIDSIADDKQFYWPSSKYNSFVDPTPNFVTPTLPTLVGDLALGNSGFVDQKPSKEVKKKNSTDNTVSFLSVSQLVDQNKTETTPAKMVARRNSGGRSKGCNSTKTKKNIKKDSTADKNAPNKSVSNIHCLDITGNLNEQFYDKTRNPSKNVSSSYSAEALIGNQICSSGSKKIPENPGKIQGTNFLPENIVTYLPTVDENYTVPNQNFQTPNFCHAANFQNASYSSNNFIYTAASTIASTYLPNTFEPTLPDYTTDNLNSGMNISKEKSSTNKHVRTSKEDKTHCSKKSKKKQTFDGGSTGFEYPFLAVPISNNSPILPEDFHVHTNILSSNAAPYSCKSNIYQKVASDFNPNPLLPLGLVRNTIPQPEISPINSASTFTNFNLSSIFPEINKGAASNIFQ